MGCNCGKKKSVSQVKKIVKPQQNKPINNHSSLKRIIKRSAY